MASIFTHNETFDDIGGRMTIHNPEWDQDSNQELNTYRSFNPIALMVEPVFHAPDEEDVDYMPFSSRTPGKTFEGRHSLFNAVNAVGNNLK